MNQEAFKFLISSVTFQICYMAKLLANYRLHSSLSSVSIELFVLTRFIFLHFMFSDERQQRGVLGNFISSYFGIQFYQEYFLNKFNIEHNHSFFKVILYIVNTKNKGQIEKSIVNRNYLTSSLLYRLNLPQLVVSSMKMVLENLSSVNCTFPCKVKCLVTESSDIKFVWFSPFIMVRYKFKFLMYSSAWQPWCNIYPVSHNPTGYLKAFSLTGSWEYHNPVILHFKPEFLVITVFESPQSDFIGLHVDIQTHIVTQSANNFIILVRMGIEEYLFIFSYFFEPTVSSIVIITIVISIQRQLATITSLRFLVPTSSTQVQQGSRVRQSLLIQIITVILLSRTSHHQILLAW